MGATDHDEVSVAPLIVAHYESIGIKKGWSRRRFMTLCKMSDCLPEEIGALCCITPHQVKRYLQGDRFPPTVSLHLAIIEAVLYEAKCGVPMKPIVPLHLLKGKATEKRFPAHHPGRD